MVAGRARFQDQVLRAKLAQGGIGFVCGPGQVGKTSCCAALSDKLLDWNDIADRAVMLRGPEAVARRAGLSRRREDVLLVLDNLHGHRKWLSLVRGLRAHLGSRLQLIIATLDPSRVPGRHLSSSSFRMRINPWSVGEAARQGPVESAVRQPTPISEEDWAALLEHGGFPEPFEKRDVQFTRRWRARQRQQLLVHDLPMFAAVRDPALVQMLAMLLAERSATHLVYSDLSRDLGVAVDTMRRWIGLLTGLQYGFLVRPWFARVPKAIRKEPKWFLRDWSTVAEPLARSRTFIACHLLKAAESWTDLGFGHFELRYVADKSRRAVDFLMLRNHKPWFLVESGYGDGEPPLAVLEHFQRCTRAENAFHVVMDAGYAGFDCFAQPAPVSVPARTFLSQLP